MKKKKFSMKKIKTNTVLSKHRRSKFETADGREKRVPYLHMTGEWLRECGLEIGKKLEIYSVGEAEVLLKAVPCCEHCLYHKRKKCKQCRYCNKRHVYGYGDGRW